MLHNNRLASAAAGAGLLPAAVGALAVSAAAADGQSRGGIFGLSAVYGAVALLSVLLAVGYILLEKRKERKFLLLYLSVAVVNSGYFLLAVSDSLEMALAANRIAYFGAAYSVMIMLLIILEVCGIHPSKTVRGILLGISTAAFLVAASGGISDLYYAEVSIETVKGATRLVKVYGPLHLFYPIYLGCCCLSMVGAVVCSVARKKISSVKYAGFLMAVVMANILVWLVEQFVAVDFEFLSVSYIVTEIMLLLIYSMLREFGILTQNGGVVSGQMALPKEAQDAPLPPNMEELFSEFAEKVKTLSAAERRILNYYIDGHEIQEIPELAYISIHTVKKHNRSIYQKLEVASRDELMLYFELFRRCGRLDDLMDGQVDAES